MQSALHLKTQVLPSGKIEIESPDLATGDIVDVFIISPQKSSVKQTSIEDIALSKAMEKGEKTELVDRESTINILENKSGEF